MMTSDEPTDNLRLTRRLKRRLVTVFFTGRYQGHDPPPVYEQVLQPIVDLVEPPA
jgi:hypothetical protein